MDAADPDRSGRRRFLRTTLAAAAGSMLLPGWANALANAPAPVLRIQRLAWAGVRLQLDSGSVFLDPLLDGNVWEQTLPDPLVPFGEIAGNRWVLVSHRHPDHCDPVAIRSALGAEGTLVYPAAGGAPAVDGVKARAAALYEPQLLGDFTATAVPASDGYGDPQSSWVVSAGGRRIIHCGDTLWHGAWWHIGRQYGPFDAAFLPINGARFGWRKPVSDVPGVMSAEQAVAAAVVLGARMIVPIHYGVAGADGYQEDPDALVHLATHAARRDMAVQVVAPGDWVEWDRS